MKKRSILLTAALMAAAALVTGCGEGSGSGGPFEPKDNINWIVTSSPGGGSDIYTKMDRPSLLQTRQTEAVR